MTTVHVVSSMRKRDPICMIWNTATGPCSPSLIPRGLEAARPPLDAADRGRPALVNLSSGAESP